MLNQDEVIRQCALCSKNHGRDVDATLSDFVGKPSLETQTALRVALVAQAAGYERSSHDGSTFEARRDAAEAALLAWDGPPPAFTITVGAVEIGTSDAELLRKLGYDTSCVDASGTRFARPMSGYFNAAISEIATALSEGLRGEPALFRAVALLRDPKADSQNAAHETKLADARLHAARVERQTAILNARARGIQPAEIEGIVR
jgi:hypothetical protein